jgi:putative sigma-54 modulation protein
MDIRISAVRGEVTQNVRDYAQTKVGKVSKFFGHAIGDVHIQISIDTPLCDCETTMSIKNHGKIVAKGRANDIHAAIDQMVDKLERQVKDMKEKVSNERKRASQRLSAIQNEQAIDSAFSEEQH